MDWTLTFASDDGAHLCHTDSSLLVLTAQEVVELSQPDGTRKTQRSEIVSLVMSLRQIYSKVHILSCTCMGLEQL